MRLFTTLAFVLAVADVAVAQDGASVFKSSCAACHAAEDGRPQNAPSIEALRRFTPESILNSLVNGKMRIQGTPLSESDRRTVAEFLGGRPLRSNPTGSSVVRCTATPDFSGPASTGDWNGWGNGTGNTRFAKDGGLSAKDLPKLKLKWAFGYADVTSARAQPALVGNRLFVASDSGEVHEPRGGPPVGPA